MRKNIWTLNPLLLSPSVATDGQKCFVLNAQFCTFTSSMTFHILLKVTYLLTPWSRVLLQKLTTLQLVKKLPAFYGTWRFIAAFTRAHHLSLSWATSIQSIPHIQLPKFHLNIILPSVLGSPQWSLSPRFPHQNPVHTSPLPHVRHMPRPSHCSRFYRLLYYYYYY